MNTKLERLNPRRGFRFSSFPNLQIRIAWAFFAALLLAIPAFAHDPYEITSTVRIESNRTTVEIEMEFNAAMALIGAPRSHEGADVATLFQAKLSELREQAGRFVELRSAGQPFTPTGTNVTLGVESHVRFDLDFPATPSGLKLNAAGLETLGARGPFGVGVTVLDMVNMKVLGQATLFPNSPEAEFAAVGSPTTNLASANVATNTSAAFHPALVQPAPASAEPPKSGKASQTFWAFVILVFFGAVLLVLVRRWRSEGGNQ